MKETASLCLHKAHYAAQELATIPQIAVKFPPPFFKEFTVQIDGDVPAILQQLLRLGYHAGLHLGRWYPWLNNCVSIAVTEKRTREEIDGLVSAFRAALSK